MAKHDDIRERLLALSPEELADALMVLSKRDPASSRFVEQLVATDKEGIARFKSRIASLKRSKRFVPRSDAGSVARDIESEIDGLRRLRVEPCAGVALLVALYDAALPIFSRCDDSFGGIGDVYRLEVANLFVDYAGQCDDRRKVVDTVVRLLEADDLSICDPLAERANEYLTPEEARQVIERLHAIDDDRGWIRRSTVASIAAAINDLELFVSIKTRDERELSDHDMYEVARMHFERGDAETARTWMERVDGRYAPMAARELRIRIYTSVGATDKLQELAWSDFHGSRSLRTLERLTALLGEDQREGIIASEIAAITASEEFSSVDATFLLEIGEPDAADEYVRRRAARIDGDHYTSLVPLAESLPPLSASLVYRALVDSILERAKSKYYPHAVRYIRKLERLVHSIPNWKGIPDHDVYVRALQLAHARKTTFWSKV